jgi:hypothetical protein
MKNLLSIPLAGLLAALPCALSTPISAQQVVVDSSTTYAGTVARYEPVDQILEVRRESAAPMTYGVTQATTFVDETGQPVPADRIVSGVPITVHYLRQGDRMTATRVVVQRAPVTVQRVERAPVAVERVERAPISVERTSTVTTTTNTGSGTITEYAPGSPNIILRSEGAAPIRYSVSRTTTFVDESGAPIAVERIAPGVPVTVQYVQEGDQMVASRVVVVRELPQRKLSHDEKEAIKDVREAKEDLQKAQRKADKKTKDKDD